MSFSTRRAKPRKIAINDASSSDPESPVVKKPPPKKTSANVRPKPKAPSRLSFGGGGVADEVDEFQIKKSALSRRAMERNAAKKSLGAVGMEKLTIAPERERVSYSKEYLEELKSAQMVASAATEEEEDAVMVDLAEDDVAMLDLDGATIVQTGESSAAGGTQIMDEGLVRVMKARRQERAAAAKAGAEDYISFHDDDDGGGEIMLRPKKKESRLVARDDFADDEEIANYVDDAERVLLTNSKSARREQERRRKQMIRATIAEAEGADDDVDGDSDVSRDSLVEEWEQDQIRKGAFTTDHATSGLEGELEALARNPPAATQLPDIKDVVARLEATLKTMEIRKASTEQQIEILIQEKKEIREREEMVQTRLKEAGEQYEKLKKETNIGGAGPEGVVDRGLESFGNTPIKVSTDD
ncbi:nineteen complex-related protein 2-domain-containing protein [Trichophaea hybrida]|nr:nineteen complex-related protein 2-domain-containing protein [Trichophaea hybrida]